MYENKSQISYLIGEKCEVTKKVLKISFSKAEEMGLNKIIIPSTTGYSAQIALELVPDSIELIIVTHVTGYIKQGENEFDPQLRTKIEKSKHKILTTTHLFKGINSYFQNKYRGSYDSIAFADGLRMVCQGIKVIVEISTMAADANMVSTRNWTVVCGGSHRGLNSSCLVKPCNSTDMSKFKLGMILALPQNEELMKEG